VSDRASWLIISVVWLGGAFGTAALLAMLYRRIHPELGFYQLWAFWTIVVSVIAALVFAFGLV
jgi:hypothetical protein